MSLSPDTNGSSGTPPPQHGASKNSDDVADEIRAELEKMHLVMGDNVAVDKTTIPLGTYQRGDAETRILSNIFGLKTKSRDIFLNHLDFKKVLKNGKTYDLIHDPKDNAKHFAKVPDYTVVENRKMHDALFKAFMAKYPGVFGRDPDLYCYDYGADLFSLPELFAPEHEMKLSADEVMKILERPFEVILKLQPTERRFNAQDFQKNFSSNLSDHDATVVRFLELATSRYCSQNPGQFLMYESKKSYFMNPQAYQLSSPDLGGGKYLAAGASKTVVCIEGPKSAGAPGVVIDSKKTPFYHSMPLLQMICDALGATYVPAQFSNASWEKAAKYVKRLECFPTYGKRTHLPITLKTLNLGDAYNTWITMSDDSKVTVYDYYRNTYNITLQHPKLPLAIGAKKVMKVNPFYPLELLYVADNQRVGNSNITSTDIATIVKACAVLPATKLDEIASCHASYSFEADGFMKNADLSVLPTPLELKARVLKPPTISYANGDLPASGDGKWRLPNSATYKKSAYIKRWGALFMKCNGERLMMNRFVEFVDKYYQECRRRGLAMPPCNQADCWETNGDAASLEHAIMESASMGLDFLLIGHPDVETSNHGWIKGLERKYSIVTQCVRTKTIFNVLTKSPLSLENIVAKTNVKMGGLNYTVTVPNYAFDDSVLFIGLGMNHPAGGLGAELVADIHVPKDDPGAHDRSGSPSTDSLDITQNVSILGFAANDGVLPNEFTGNFFFQPMHRDEKISVLDQIINEIMERFVQNRKRQPSRVIFYRSGASEGAFSKILRYEIPILKHAIKKRAPKAWISVLLPSKVHAIRLFKTNINRGGRSNEQNIAPGTVVDQHVVSKAFPEFYLNSHLAIQGSAKTPKYTILYTDDPEASMDMFQRWTNGLAYDFQIVTSPTSLPAPVYIANRYSERGRQIYNAFPDADKANLSQDRDSPPSRDGNDSDSFKNKYYARSLLFNFTQRPALRAKRVNA